MSPRSWQDRIADILRCARNIQDFTNGMTWEAFAGDPRTIRAVAYELTTIGEAVRFIPQEIQNEHPEIPWRQMQAFRNVLVHEYYRLDEEIIWKTVQEDIPELIKTLENLCP